MRQNGAVVSLVAIQDWQLAMEMIEAIMVIMQRIIH